MGVELLISLLIAAGPAHVFQEASGIVGRKTGDGYTLYLIEDNLNDNHVISGEIRIAADSGDIVEIPRASFGTTTISGLNPAKKLDLESIDTDPHDPAVLWLLNEGTASIILVRAKGEEYEQFREIALCESAMECVGLDSGVEGLAVLSEGGGYRVAVLAEGGDDGGELLLPRVYVFNLDANYATVGPASESVRLDEAGIEQLAGGDRGRNFMRATDLVWFGHVDRDEHLLVSLVSMNFSNFNNAYIACFSQAGKLCPKHRLYLPEALPKIHEGRKMCFNWEGLGWLDSAARNRLMLVNDNENVDSTHIFALKASLLTDQTK